MVLSSLSHFQTGFLAACPYLFKAILGPLGGVTADGLIRYKICTIGTVRKTFYAAGNCVYVLSNISKGSAFLHQGVTNLLNTRKCGSRE